MLEFFISYSYFGMFVAAFLAGSIFPFSSETVMVSLQMMGADPMKLLLWGSAGNVLGSMFNFCIARLGKIEWLKTYFHVSQTSLDRAEKFVKGKGAWVGFLAFVPVLGSGITIMLGFMKANVPISVLSISVGKILRYTVLIYGGMLIMGM